MSSRIVLKQFFYVLYGIFQLFFQLHNPDYFRNLISEFVDLQSLAGWNHQQRRRKDHNLHFSEIVNVVTQAPLFWQTHKKGAPGCPADPAYAEEPLDSSIDFRCFHFLLPPTPGTLAKIVTRFMFWATTYNFISIVSHYDKL